jgi:hypothetical protein
MPSGILDPGYKDFGVTATTIEQKGKSNLEHVRIVKRCVADSVSVVDVERTGVC